MSLKPGDPSDGPWRVMIALNAAVMAALFFYKISFSYPDLPYTQLLADYHFGLMKRSLIGALVGLAFPILPSWSPYVIGTVMWLVTSGLFLLLFRKTFGFARQHLPLFAVMLASPLFLKNFVQTLGYYDIYGCAVAMLLLLVPARSALYVVGAALGAMILIMIHHLHLLLYIPTIGAIVLLRYYLLRPLRTADVLLAVALVLLVGACFVVMQFDASPAVPQEQLTQYLRSRMTDPAHGEILPYIFYRSLVDEIRGTWLSMPRSLQRLPVYAVLIALHAPLIRYFCDLVRNLAVPMHRRVVITAIVSVSLGYLVIFATVFDYSRWVASWATCMILLLHATKQLPAQAEAAPIQAGDRRARVLGWILTAIPRLGTVTPF
jgi:hypothetical protein